MTALFLIILFVGLLAGTILSMAPQNRRNNPAVATQVPVPPKRPLPCFRRNDFFSSAERSFYDILRRLTPNHTVFAKVRLADLVFVPKTSESHDHLNRLDRKHIDFVVCDESLAPVVAIKLDDARSLQTTSRSRDEFVEEVLAAVALPVIRLRAPLRYSLDDIHRLIAPYLRIGTPFI